MYKNQMKFILKKLKSIAGLYQRIYMNGIKCHIVSRMLHIDHMLYFDKSQKFMININYYNLMFLFVILLQTSFHECSLLTKIGKTYVSHIYYIIIISSEYFLNYIHNI